MSSTLNPPDRSVVGMGDMAVRRGGGTIITHALGSCIAVCLHHPQVPAAGMLHFMLPDSRVDANRARTRPLTFADLGMKAMLLELRAQGAPIAGMTARLVGGASIPGAPHMFDIGNRNLLIARRLLWQARIRLVASEVGGEISRTASMDVVTGRVTVTTPGLAPRIL